MKMPAPRGPASAALTEYLRLEDHGTTRLDDDALHNEVSAAVAASPDILTDDDLQLALFLMYELHYTGIDGVRDELEWSSSLIAARGELERGFEAGLRDAVTMPELPLPIAEQVAEALFELTAPTPGPSLARYIAKNATREQLHEFLIQRSIYTLKEADPDTWMIPRLRGRAKAALIEIQTDEYGGGRQERIHANLYARTMRGAGLDDSYGAYLDLVPAITLASLNITTMFGLHRRLRGASVGHLAAFEMTSSLPSRMIAEGFRRNGYGDQVTDYFDEHVEADAVHEQIAARDLAGGLVEAQPELLADVMFGAAACLTIDGRAADHIRSRWEAGETSLRHAFTLEAA
ncbi:iron-containing redox enzyme family protein [Klugiella sp. YN-L-19]|uniref:Iron-containing redox enzyme family protein n=2 Tax=Ruicaihuangia caeni TaxID=3042517 RepID=A0AAW6TCW7_9MICO|nr:iron-containing redox enzyme family protein [Klugiella sp. YN-L-19]MDI2099225.1 iron-containing redox enzyme family protein [Klugiella sp. YN-L-19]